MKPNFQIPERNITYTHKLKAGSRVYSTIPYSVENPNPPVGDILIVDADTNVLAEEQYIAVKGLYTKILLNDQIYYTLDSNLSVLEEVESLYNFLKVTDSGDIGFVQEDGDIPTWQQQKSFNCFYYQKTGQYYCIVEREYEGTLSDEQIKQYMEEDYISGLQVIFKANFKKYKKDYITDLSKKSYFFGSAKEWNIKARGCSNFYTLVTFPRRLLETGDIIDYRTNPLEAVKDNINGGLLNPNSSDIKYIVRLSMKNFQDFENQINTLRTIIHDYGDKEYSYLKEKVNEYIGPITVPFYKSQTGLDLYEEMRNFSGDEKQGNFVNTIKLLLQASNADIDTLYTDVKENNILFGLDERYNICYIDVIRNNKFAFLSGQEHIFQKDFGDYGVISPRDGFLLYSYAFIHGILISNDGTGWNEPFNNQLDYELFVKKFIIPPPREFNYPKKSMECVKDVTKKLQEDVLIESYKDIKYLTQISQFQINKLTAEKNLKAKEVFWPLNSAYENYIVNPINAATSSFGSGINFLTSSFTPGTTAFNTMSKGALNEVNNLFRRVDFQKALLVWLTCLLKDASNEQFNKNLDWYFNNKTKQDIQNFLKTFFCNQNFFAIIKAFNAIKIPKLQTIDLNKAVATAIQKAIYQLITEMYYQLIKDMIAGMQECGNKNSPYTPEQELGINSALDNLLNSNDDPSNNQDLNNVYDLIGLPEANSGEDRANEQTKKQIKNLVSDLSCLLLPTEICMLMAEGRITLEVNSIISSVILTKYPDLSVYLGTPKQITDFFYSLGKAINISDACASLASEPDIVRTYCDDGSLDAAIRDKLKNNDLTSKQIDDLVDDLNKKRQQRISQVWDGLQGKPEDIPLLCQKGKPGQINLAKVDPNYANTVQDLLDSTMKPIYKMFDDDIKEWPNRTTKDTLVDFSKDDINQLMKASNSQSGDDAIAVRQLLINKGVMVQSFETNQDGTPDKNKPILSADGKPTYKFNDKRPPTPPIIAPILTDTIILKDGEHFQQDTILKNNKLTFRVISDIEREKFKALAQVQASADLDAQIKQIYAEFSAKSILILSNEAISIALESLLGLLTGVKEDDLGFWIGWSTLEEKYKQPQNLVISWISYLTGLLEIADAFFADLTFDERKQRPSLVESTNILTAISGAFSIRSVQAKNSGKLQVSKISDNLDAISVGGTELGTVDSNFYALSSQNKATISKIEEAEQISLNNKELWQKELESERPIGEDTFYNVEKISIIQKNLDANNKELEQTQTQLAEARQTQVNVSKVTQGSLDMSVFDAIETSTNQFNAELKIFENSLVMGGILKIARNVVSLLNETKDKISTVYSSVENGKKQLAMCNTAFPDYEIIYEYGNNNKNIPLQSNISNLTIKKNNTNLINNIILEEEIDSTIKDYVNNNRLFANYDESISAQEHIFKNYLKSKNISINYYKKVEKDYFDILYSELKNSVFYQNSKINNQYIPNIKFLKLIEGVFTDSDSACGLNHNPLDIDEIKSDAMKRFTDEACNFEEPDALGNKRNKMNPIENTVSEVLIYTTLRVYLYDYYLKGIFLFDKYHIGITATDPMIEYLAKCFEVEMTNMEPLYYKKFLANTATIFDKKYKDESDEINSKYTESMRDTVEVATIKFKKMIQKELLYISKRLTDKIDKCLEDLDMKNSFGFGTEIKPKNIDFKRNFLAVNNKKDSKYNKLTKIFPFFDSANDSLLRIQEQGEYSTIYYDDKQLLREKTQLLKDNQEFKLIFEYCFPIRKYISLVTMQEMMCGNAYLDSSRAFIITKGMLKTSHNDIMNARGINTPNDRSVPAGSAQNKPGSGGAKNDAYLEMLTRLLVQIPLQTLKGLCESADPNVFFATLPYNIVKPITLALQNQIPIIPAIYDPFLKETKNTTLADGTTVTTTNPKMIRSAIPMFYSIPALGATLAFCGLFPTPFGILYYSLCGIKGTPLWWDDMIDNKEDNVVSAGAAVDALQNSGISVEVCELVNLYKDRLKPKINRDELLITEYN